MQTFNDEMKSFTTSLDNALAISAEKADQMGCTGVTQFWWIVIDNNDGSARVLFPPEDTVLLPVETVKTIFSGTSGTITTDDLTDYIPPTEIPI